MAWLIGLLLASSLTVEVDAGVQVPNASSADKVNTAILHTAGRPGPSFLLFGFPKLPRIFSPPALGFYFYFVFIFRL